MSGMLVMAQGPLASLLAPDLFGRDICDLCIARAMCQPPVFKHKFSYIGIPVLIYHMVLSVVGTAGWVTGVAAEGQCTATAVP